MDWINFDDIKKAGSLEMVLQHYGITLKRVNGISLRGKCPLPLHDSNEWQQFYGNLSKGVGGVWACQSQFCIAARDGKKGGDTLEFLATMEGCSLRETAETMHTWFGAIAVQTPPPTDECTEKPQLASKENSEPGTGVNKPLNFALRDIDPRHPYLVSRGVTEEPIRSTRPLILTPQLPVTRWHAVLALRAFREHDCHFGSFTSAPLFRRLAVPHEADDQQ